MSEEMTAADALVRVLEAEGVKYVFGIPGSHILPFYDALARSKKIKTILTKHEGGAAFMARMYVRASGKPAVCAATAGPGATNLVTGVADAFCENVPVIVITGQAPTGLFGMNAMQEATGEGGTPNQVEVFRSIAIDSFAVYRAEKVAQKMRQAFRLAWSPPFGPVHICLPSDILAAAVTYEHLERHQYRVTSWNQVDIEAVQEAADMLVKSQRPAIVAGHRAVFPDASEEITALVEEFNIPVATSVVAKGIVSENHPLSLGVSHLFGHRSADKYLKEADCVLAVGEDFGEYSSNYYDPEMIPSGGIIQIDSPTDQIGKIYPLALGIAGNIKATLRRLLRELRQRNYRSAVSREDIDKIKRRTAHFDEPEMSSDAVPIKPQRFYRELRRALPEDALVQVDIGQNFFWSLRYFEAPQGRYFGTWGFVSMGVGAAGAVGLSLARPGARVVCICGDGAMQMNGMELATAVNYSLPITWVVFNDGRLNMVHMAQGMSYGEQYIATEMKNPDFALFARAFGVRGFTVEGPDEIGPTLTEAADGGGPAVIDLKVDGAEMLPIKPRTVLMASRMGLGIGDSGVASRALRKVLNER